MERRIFDCLPMEDAVRNLSAIPLSTRQIYMKLPFTYRSVQTALYRMREYLYVERDGREYLYARKEGSEPPVDGRGRP
jgi:hypothetical protein